MPRLADETRFFERQQGFKGYNDRLPPEFLPRGYLADALNCFMRTGEIVKRNGYSLIGNNVGTAKACQGIRGSRWADGSKEILGVFNGSIYKWTGSGNWSLISGGSGVLSTTAPVTIEIANNAAYFFDGASTVPKYTPGGSISTISAIPLGKYAKWFHNQLHVAGIAGSPNKLKSSDIGAPETFTGGNSSDLDVNPNDGDYITSLNTLKDELSIFKEKRIWSATGFGTSTLTLAGIAERTSGIGTIAPRSTVNIGNELLYLSFFGGIPHFRSIMRTMYGVIVDNGIISTDIEGTMLGLNLAQLSQCAGVFDGRYVFWAVCNSGSATNNLVLAFDTVTRSWTRHVGINASCWETFTIANTPQVYFGEATAVSKAYVFDGSTSDNGTAINFSITTARSGGSEAEHKNKYKWLYVRAKESGNYNVTVDYSVDGFTYGNLGTLNLAGTGSTFDMIVLDSSKLGATDVKRKRFVIPKSRNYYIQFKMYDTSTTSVVTIRNWDLMYMKKRPINDN